MGIHKLDTQMYVGQKAFISKAGKVLVLRDPDHVIDGQVGLDFPGGKYRWGKDLKKELQREVDEETSVKIKIGDPFISWTNYNYRTKGERANIFVIGYMCDYLSREVNLSDEHDSFEWVGKKTYKKWQENSEYYKALEKYFKLKGLS